MDFEINLGRVQGTVDYNIGVVPKIDSFAPF